MKKIYITFLIASLLSGCYIDKGNYNYSELKDLKIDLPFENYDVGIGKSLSITPTITTTLDESDLSYQWEIGDYSETVDNYYTFLKLTDGKNLNHNFNLSEHMKGPGTYKIRLRVNQKSTSRSFFSSLITINLKSEYSGLIILHGDDNQSDIGLLQASEFLVNAGTIKTSVTPDLYSQVNSEKIQGKGKSIIQSYTYYLDDVNRTTVVAITDKGAVWAKYADLSKGGDWNSMFNPGINSGKPEFYHTQGQVVYAVDNGKIFLRQNNNYSIFPIPVLATASYTAGSPFFEVSGRVQGFFFDKILRGFVVTTNIYGYTSFSSNAGDYFKQISTSNYFNLSSMNANLLHVDKGGQAGNYMAVMKEDNGNKYLAQINWAASSDANIPVARYDMNVLPEINDSKFFAFGDDQAAMCYYASSYNIYRFTALPGNSLEGKFNRLQMENGSPISIDGEITMLKVLKPLKNTGGSLKVNYHNYNKILLVGVYKNGKGTLYSFNIKEATGDVITYKTFTGFDKIYDANLKAF